MPYARPYHDRADSKVRLVSPYGLIGRSWASSGIGVASGVPYTAADDENTTRVTPTARAPSSSATPPATLSR